MNGREAPTRPSAPLVEIAAGAERARWAPAWRDLVARAEPNAFADPSFLEPALARLAGRVRLVLIWRDGRRRDLIAVLALTPARFGFARLWRHEQAALGAILIEREAAGSALGAFNAWLSRTYPLSAGWLAPFVSADGALVEAAQSLARCEALNPRRRAALIAGQGPRPAAAGGKHRREWERAGRRLSERGRLELRVGADEAAIERFLALEASGWKGARGTALKSEPRRAAFAREMLAAFAARGGLRIHELALEDQPLAAVVELRSGGRGYLWKIAYDERFSDLSPGVQLLRAVSRRLEAEAGVDLVDSCAEADHPLIGRLWSDRLALVDLAVLSGPPLVARIALASERAGAWLRALAKRRWLAAKARFT